MDRLFKKQALPIVFLCVPRKLHLTALSSRLSLTSVLVPIEVYADDMDGVVEGLLLLRRCDRMHLIRKLGRLAPHSCRCLALPKRVPEINMYLIHRALLGHFFEDERPRCDFIFGRLCILLYIIPIESMCLL